MGDRAVYIEEIAEILKTTERKAAEMLEKGELVGRRSGRSWTMAYSRLMEYIRKEGEK